MAAEAFSCATARFVCELEANGQEEGKHELKLCLAIAKQVNVGRFVLKIDRNGPVFSWWFGLASHGSLAGQMVCTAQDTP